MWRETDLIEIGVDVLWGPELQVNGIDALGEKFAGKVCFAGYLDTQQVLPFGIQEDVKKHVVHAIQALGSHDGGLSARARSILIFHSETQG